MCDVVLISPPVSTSAAPSLALGLLKACLTESGISCKVDYADLRFTAMLDRESAPIIEGCSMGDFFGEFVFNEKAGIRPRYGMDAVYQRIRERTDAVNACATRNALIRTVKIASDLVDETVRRVLSARPKLVGVTSCFQQRNAALAILKEIKRLRPDIVTVMGGANCFGHAGLAILRRFDFVDYVFFGESDDIFADVCGHAMAGEDFPLPYGVLKQGMPLPEQPPHRIVDDLDALPYPDFDDYFEAINTDYGRNARNIADVLVGTYSEVALFLEASRGCWWGEKQPCSFCGLHDCTRKYRFKSPERILRELTFLSEKYNTRNIVLTDCVMPKNWVNDVLPRLKELPVKLRLFQEVRTSMKPEDVRLMAEAGFVRVQPGVESLSGHELRLMNKGVSVLQNLAFLKACRQYGITPSWNLLYGFPGESIDDFVSQLRLMPAVRHLCPPNSAAPLVYARNNEYTLHPEKYGLHLTPAPMYGFICPDDDAFIDDIAIYYDSGKPLSDSIKRAGNALNDDVSKWQKENPLGNRVRLEAAETENGCLVIDTRSCRDVRAQLLFGAEKAVFLLCDGITSRQTLLEKLSPSFEPDEIDRAITSLLMKKLMVKSGELFLTLAVITNLEALKRHDAYDFQKQYAGSSEMRALFQNIREGCMTDEEAITRLAHRMSMCFDGDDYQNMAQPV